MLQLLSFATTVLVARILDPADYGVMALAGLLAEGKLKHKTTVVDGLDSAPDALHRLFTGDHDGVNVRRAINGESLVDHWVCGRLFWWWPHQTDRRAVPAVCLK